LFKRENSFGRRKRRVSPTPEQQAKRTNSCQNSVITESIINNSIISNSRSKKQGENDFAQLCHSVFREQGTNLGPESQLKGEGVSTKYLKSCQRAHADPPIRRDAGRGNRLKQWVLLLILSIPSVYVFLTLPPLWRDSDAFNEIASAFAPRGIIHFLPGYCLGGRLIIFTGSIVANLLGGRAIPYLSISNTPLTDAGIYTLIVAQHLFLVLSLFYAAKSLSDRFPMRALAAVVFALTPWLYVYANCIGTEAFSNPLVYLIAACGWNCLRTAELNREKIFVYFGLLLAAALTRHINALLIAGLPIALLPLAGKELIRRSAATNLPKGKSGSRSTRRLLIFVVVGLSAIGASVLVQQTMCWLFRVPYRSTFGETLSYRLSYLEVLPEQARTAILGGISAKLADPVVTEAFDALNRSLNRGEKWPNTFLYDEMDQILLRSGQQETQSRTFQVDLKLNRIATCVLLSGESNYLEVVWTSFVLSPFFSQTDLASPPFELTDWLQSQLHRPMYEQLRGLTSFQHPQGYYGAVWKQIPYFHLFEGIPMLEMACLTIALAIVFTGLALVGISRDPVTGAGAWYALSMIIVGLLISLAICLSTYFQGRLYLPVYSLFQFGMLLAVSLAANVLLQKLEGFKNRLN
jgi:hypothetical protein